MEFIKTTIQDRKALVVIDRPKALNALNAQVIQELSTTFTELENNEEVRVIVLTGAGDKAFVAGADIKEFSNFDQAQGEALSRQGQEELFDKIENLNKPVIAAINGYALGGGLELALACHMRMAADGALLGLPETSLGLIPGYGGTQRLPKLIGKGRANEMIFTAKPIEANDAYQMGLVNSVESPDLLIVEANNMADEIIKNSGNAIANAILATNAIDEGEKGFAKEQKLFGELFQSKDFKEGVSAFLEKRKPTF